MTQSSCYFIQELGVNPNAQITVPVLVACESGNLELVKFLITDRGCDPWDCDSAGNTSLHYACKSSNLSLVKFLDQCNLMRKQVCKGRVTLINY